MAVSKRLRFEVFKRDSHTCRYCGRSAPDVSLTIDHVVPVALGGLDEPGNLVTACAECNGGKSSVSPDAPVVADVQEDALRWSRAIATAARQMLADQECRDAAYNAFDQKWQSWTVKGSPLPRPNGWQQSVDAFVAAGLPMAVLLGCVDVAMANDKLRPENRFRYVCGIAWKKVAELQKRARAVIGGGPKQQESAYDFINDFLLSHVEDPDLWESYLERAAEYDDYEPDDDEDYKPRSREWIAAELVIEDWNAERHRLIQAIKQLFRQVGHETVRQMRQAEIAEYEARDWAYSDDDLTAGIIRRIAVTHAEAYLNNLPQATRDEWLACAATYHRINDPRDLAVILTAAEYAQGERVLRSLCDAPGKHGARCPNRVKFKIWFIECPACKEECTGHESLCEEHLGKVLSGHYRTESGDQFELADFAEIEETDPWGSF